MQKKSSQDSLFAALGVAPAKSPTESGATLFTSDKERTDDPLFGGDPLAPAPSKPSQPMPASPFKPPQDFKPPPPVVAAPDPLVQASVVDDDPLSMMSAATETAAAAAAAAAKAAAAARKAEELFKSEAVDSVRPIENPLSMPPRGSSSESLSSSAGPPPAFSGIPPPPPGDPPSWPSPRVPLHVGEAQLDRPAAAQCVLTGLHEKSAGTLYLTNLRMIWEPLQAPNDAKGANEAYAGLPAVLGLETPRLLSVPLYSIVSKKIYRSQAGVIFELLQKYNSRPALRVGLSESDCSRISASLTLHLKPPANPMEVRANVQRSYAVLHGSQLAPTVQREAHSNAFKGWTSTYDASADYQRMGLLNPLSHWRVSEQNADYQLCGTYPAKLVVPRSVKDDDLLKASQFRSAGRVPVLCWKDPFGVASICRSSQPCVGVSKWACPQDEALLQAIADTNPFNEQLQIIDCRSRVNAELNTAKGKGYEHQTQYINTKISFMSIENIHVMRASLKTFLKLLEPKTLNASKTGELYKEEDSFLSDLDKSGWMGHILKIIRTTATVVKMISVDRASVLVHGSDGWDRTPQVTALAQLMLDPHYRTIAGFQQLLVKEWLSFGHQFALRCATLAPLEHGHYTPSDEEMSPVFVQYIECVWQISQQLPKAFEFNSRYLATLLYHVTSCEHGTFLCDCERQRVELGLPTCATSLWAELDGPEFLNQEYVPDAAILMPNLSASALKPWTAYYTRGAEIMLEDPQSLLEVRVHKLSEENARLKRELQALQAIQVVASQGEASTSKGAAAGDHGSAAAATDGAADAPTAATAASTLTRQLTDKELQDLNGQAPPLSPGTVAAALEEEEEEEEEEVFEVLRWRP